MPLKKLFEMNTKIFFSSKHDIELPLIMGILNVTPDSFSDGGKYFDGDSAFEHAKNMIDKGADIIDIGGESTRPGAVPVSAEEEIRRTTPIIKRIIDFDDSIIISIDTTKSEVARCAVNSGAKIINDISGGQFDEAIFSVAAEFNIPIVINHIKGNPQTMQDFPDYKNIMDEVSNYFLERISVANSYGVTKIILDPGIGFGKLVEHNYELLSELNSFKTFGYPLMIGLSRKSFLGKSLGLEVSERDVATVIAETIAAEQGADMIRTHNIDYALQMKKIITNVKRHTFV